MNPLAYHAGQRAVQDEAQTRRVADKLADWVGPVPDFARGADLVVLALPDNGAGLRFTVLSGRPPLVAVVDGPEFRLMLPPELAGHVDGPTACGGLVISLGLARRASSSRAKHSRCAGNTWRRRSVWPRRRCASGRRCGNRSRSIIR